MEESKRTRSIAVVKKKYDDTRRHGLSIVGVDSLDDKIDLFCEAAWRGDIDQVRHSLVDLDMDGADINTKNSRGQTALHCAAMQGHEEIVQELLKKSVDVNCTDSNGNTPLHHASGAPHPNVISILLSYGCDITIKNFDEHYSATPRERARAGAYIVWKTWEEKGILGLIEQGFPVWAHGRDISLAVRWFFKDFTRWKAYDDQESEEIEAFYKLYRTGQGSASITINGQPKSNTKYNFEKMIEFKSVFDKAILRGTWFWLDDTMWVPFPESVARTFENAFLNNNLQKIVFSTNPPKFIQDMPDGSIRLFQNRDPIGQQVKRGYPLQPKEGLPTLRELVSPRFDPTKSRTLPRNFTETNLHSPEHHLSMSLAPSSRTGQSLNIPRKADTIPRYTPSIPAPRPTVTNQIVQPLVVPSLPPHEDKATFRIRVLFISDSSPTVVTAECGINCSLEDFRNILVAPPHSISPATIKDSLFKIPGSSFLVSERVPLQNINYFLNCYLRKDDVKLAMVSKTDKYHSMFYQTSQQINMLLKTVSLSSFYKDTEDQIDEFRQTMAIIRNRERKNAPRIPINIGFGPEIQLSEILVTVRFGQNLYKTIKTNNESVDQFIIKNWKYFKEHFPNKNPEDFLLRVVGIKEYLAGDIKLFDFDCIRDAVSSGQKIIELVLQPTEEIEDDKIYPFQWEEEFIEDKKELKYDHDQLHNKPEEPIKGANLVSVWDINDYYRIKINQVSFDHFPIKTSLKSPYLFVGMWFYCGDEELCPPQNTPLIQLTEEMKSASWDTWFLTTIKVSDLPRLSKICMAFCLSRTGTLPPGALSNIISSSPSIVGEIEVLASVNWLMFDEKHQLLCGENKVKLWEEKVHPLHPCGSNNTAPHAIMLTLELDTFDRVVVFPTEVSPYVVYKMNRTVSPNDEKRLKEIINSNALIELNDQDKQLIWRYRTSLPSNPNSLPKLFQSVQKTDRFSIQEMYQMLDQWDIPPAEAIELLGASYADLRIRNFAVNKLENLSNEELEDFLLQLVQVLKFECYTDSALSRFLIKRSIQNKRIGHYFYWLLKSELHDLKVSQRFALILEAFLRSSTATRKSIENQEFVQNQLILIANAIKTMDSSKGLKHLQTELANLNTSFPPNSELLLDPKFSCKGIIVEKCKIMDSAKKPLWIVFQNADPYGPERAVIFKVGDDLHQDMLTLQLLRVMDKLWKKSNLNLKLNLYPCIVTGKDSGMIQVVNNAKTLSKIQKEVDGVVAGALKDSVLYDWLFKHNNEAELEIAIQNFTASCAGYCVATYVLGIGDRHNDNIMLQTNGHFFHIDFGHFLGNFKTFLGISRERVPFVFTPDMAYTIMRAKKEREILSPRSTGRATFSSLRPFKELSSGQKAEENINAYNEFLGMCNTAHAILRKNADLFISLLTLMISSGMPELESKKDLLYVVDTLSETNFHETLNQTGRQLSTRFNFLIHNIAHM